MEGNIDTAHISHLHQWDGIDDIPDDGSDKPGYPSNAMSWKFWRHDRAPRLELDDTWYGYRYAGIRTTPNGNTHVRITAYVAPLPHHGRQHPVQRSGRGCSSPSTTTTAGATSPRPRTWRNPRNLGGANLFSIAPFSTPVSTATDGIVPRRYTAENDYLIDREVQRTSTFSGVADFVSQDLMVTESMGPIYDRTQEQLGSTDKAISRMRHLLISAAKGLAEARRRPPSAPAWTSGRSAAPRRSSNPARTGATLGTDDDPVVREALGATTGEQLTDMVD